jgi:Xaa-Pro dipeptidase
LYPHQAERLVGALERGHLDALVATSPENIAYITGFRSPDGAVAPTPNFGVFSREGAALVVPAIEASSTVADAADVDHIVCYGESRASCSDAQSAEARRRQAVVATATSGPAEALAAALDRLGVRHGSVGLDESRLTPEAWQRLGARLSGLKAEPAADHLAAARRVKGPYEIECLGQALRLAEEALDSVIQRIDRGMTEREAATLFAAEVVTRGGWPHPPLVAIGDRTGIRASWPTDRALRAGNLVRFDVGCIYKGYCSRVVRTAVLGEPVARQEALYRAVQVGLEETLAAVKDGVLAGRVFGATVEAVRANGLPDYDADDAGHGIGLEPRETPTLAPGSGTPLELGEVLSVGVSHYQIGSMGVAVRDTALITTAGARVLNRSHRGLVVLD